MVRIVLWDNAKYFMIMLVVLAHFTDVYSKTSGLLRGVTLFIYAFHMPAFIFVSGLFCGGAVRSRSFPVKKIIPYFKLFLLVQILIYVSVKLTVYPSYRLSFITINTAAWFAFAVFVFYIITWLISGISIRYTLPVSIFLACFSGYFDNIGDILCLSRIVVFYPFFLAGSLVSYDNAEKLLDRKTVKIASALFIILAAAAVYIVLSCDENAYKFLLSLFRGRFSFSIIASAAPFEPALPWYAVRAAHLLLASLLSLAFFSLTPRNESLFSHFGQRTTAVYVLHMPVLYILRRINIDECLIKIFGNSWDAVYLLIPAAVTVILSAEFPDRVIRSLLRTSADRTY